VRFGVKAGKLSNGYERGKGQIIHAIECSIDSYLDMQYALCGDRPKILWAEREVTKNEVTCKKCLKKIEGLKNGNMEK
jgi:hypothetical protein